MCIIITCESGVRPNYDLIENCFYTNPDGAGLMWVENGKVETTKGLFDPSDLMACINGVPQESPIVVHMRIATSGGIDVGTCHPFPICSDLDILHAADVECSAAVAHNGIIKGMPTNAKLGISDTVSFVSDYLAPMFNGKVTKQMKGRIKQIAPGNRFAIMTKDGKVSRIGEGWETVRPGIQASNGTWRYEPLRSYRSYRSHGYTWSDAGYEVFGSTYYPFYDYDADEDERYEKMAQQANEIACGEFECCCGCQHFGSCAAFGPFCDDVAARADMLFEDLIWYEDEKQNELVYTLDTLDTLDTLA